LKKQKESPKVLSNRVKNKEGNIFECSLHL
jgi:hypothetical protein